MDVKVCLCLLLLGVVCCNARELADLDLVILETEDVSALWVNNLEEQRQLEPLNDVGQNEGLCKMCEEYTGSALGYLANNETQTMLFDVLHQTCSKMPIYKHECTVLVDQYAPIFFSEVSSIKPDALCQKVNLCQQVVSISQQFTQNHCDLCHQVVEEALVKLEDPDTRLDILEMLLKACRALDHYANKCKRIVFEYAPVILINAQQFLENNDVCTILHACEPEHQVHASS